MIKKNNILCIVAHPDDEALGVGGTLIKHCESGDNVHIVIISEGEDSKSKKNEKNPNRKNNAENWCRITGCNLYSILNFPDQRLDQVPQLDIVQELEIILKDILPDIVYIHFPSDLNRDHQIAAEASLAAIRPISGHKVNPEIRAFETPSSTEQAPNIEPYIFKANFYVEIYDQWEKKILALNSYSHEMRDYPHPRSIKSIEGLAIKRGSESGLKMAEAFCILRKLWR